MHKIYIISLVVEVNFVNCFTYVNCFECLIMKLLQASLPSDIEAAIQHRFSQMHEPSVVAHLYWCQSPVHGRGRHVKQLMHIIENGFTISGSTLTLRL